MLGYTDKPLNYIYVERSLRRELKLLRYVSGITLELILGLLSITYLRSSQYEFQNFSLKTTEIYFVIVSEVYEAEVIFNPLEGRWVNFLPITTL